MKTLVIETEKLRANVKTLQDYMKGTPIWAVLKCNAYGMGLIPFAKTLAECGIDRFAVSDAGEAALLRENGFEQEILLLSAAELPDEIETVIRCGLTATIASQEGALALSEAAEKAGKTVDVHINVETGFGRFGFNSAEEFLAVSGRIPGLCITGAYSHLSNAFGEEKTSRIQLERFQKIVSGIEAGGISIPMKHICNSSAALRFPDMHLDAVRIGSAFLGRLSFEPPVALSKLAYLEAEVSYVKTLPEGANVGYANTCRLKRRTTTAVIYVGYADGFAMEKKNDTFRFLDILRYTYHALQYFLKDNRTYVRIGEKRYPLLGRISMYNIIADVTGSGVKPGDKVRIEINPILVNPSIERSYR